MKFNEILPVLDNYSYFKIIQILILYLFAILETQLQLLIRSHQAMTQLLLKHLNTPPLRPPLQMMTRKNFEKENFN